MGYDKSRSQSAIPVYLIDVNGEEINLNALLSGSSGASNSATDTNGAPVPTYKPHSYTYDGSGNLATDTVTDGTSTWVRTYTYTNGAQTTDSGWVKQ